MILWGDFFISQRSASVSHCKVSVGHIPLPKASTSPPLSFGPLFPASLSSLVYSGIAGAIVCASRRMEDFPSNTQMIEFLRNSGKIRTDRVEEVMRSIDRGIFAPERKAAYYNKPLSFGYNASMAPPNIHAVTLELLADHLKPGMRALDIGSGTGYLTACFAYMVGHHGRSVGVEHVPRLVDASISMIKKSAVAQLMDSQCLSVHVSDGFAGWEAAGPYDAINVGAGVTSIPTALFRQLKLGGRMLIPLGQRPQKLTIIDKKINHCLDIEEFGNFYYPPLTSLAHQMNGE